jgi:hypothetical protein
MKKSNILVGFFVAAIIIVLSEYYINYMHGTYDLLKRYSFDIAVSFYILFSIAAVYLLMKLYNSFGEKE